MSEEDPDFLDEMIQEAIDADPEFPELLEEAEKQRQNKTE